MDESQLSVGIGSVWAILSVVGRWLLFRKAGKPGWHSIIPFLSDYDEFAICWKGRKYFLCLILIIVATACGIAGKEDPIFMTVAAVAVLGVFIIHFRQSMKLAKAFGKGPIAGILLFIFDRLGRVILGLGGAEYVGKE